MNNFDWLDSEYAVLIIPYALRVLGALALCGLDFRRLGEALHPQSTGAGPV